ncbi:aldose 1-epimerase family protein [Dyadobacter chenwenxiniae]|uniref:Aldose 1-epimerase family protein n=1 Tax=Dyadobacter chenwenxiniae TaxID=2906456 RepID=A0A9X1TLU0_9BACT|nr:aldose 1-epimerase family protein [Dyadobacter chenwenxiniae]MCF0062743.1 aldose 1-epimerase family protein [Dyadobacter chenwenxiniae]UON85080.1 aldose 1-epimerase family protein [Dyadobacter chenwenxiniae]
MNYSIENQHLKIAVQETGAELIQIQSTVTGKDFLWDADPNVWASHAPVLFPVIGAIKNGFVTYQGKQYAVPRHGFIRNNADVKLINQTADSLTFGLKFSETTLEIYPFEFEFLVTYSLKENRVIVNHEVINHGTEEMLFSLGGHPAFKCPLHVDEVYEDYYLEFYAVENDSTWLLEKNGLVGNTTKPILENTNILHLNEHLFDNDALIFKHLVSKQVSLRSIKSSQVITVHYDDFKYLGIWAKPGGHFVCIEPWLGIADSADSDQNFETKEGILKLAAGGKFEAKFEIEISE